MGSPKKPEARTPRGAGARKGRRRVERQCGAESKTHGTSSPARSPPSSPARSPPSSPARASPPRPRGAGARKGERRVERQCGAESKTHGTSSPARSPSSSTARSPPSSPARSPPPSPARASPPGPRGAGARKWRRSVERQCGAESKTHCTASPARSPPSSPAQSPPSPPSRSPPSSPARASAPSASSSPKSAAPPSSPDTAQVTPVFDIFLDDARNSVGKAFDGIRELFTSILKNDHLVEDKLVTKTWGSFMIRIFLSAKSTEEPVCGLYRTHDIYLDSVLSAKMWYRFMDYQAILPQEVESEGSISFDFESNYKGLDCDPDVAEQIKVGNSEARKAHQTLQRLAFKHLSSAEVKEALVLFVLLAEALRFPEFERWFLKQIEQEESLYIPIKCTALFRMWGRFSIAFHDGRDKFSEALEIVKTHCQTYDDLCLLLGIVNKVNWRKKTKATKGKKKNKKNSKSRQGKEAEASPNNKRRKRRKKKQ